MKGFFEWFKSSSKMKRWIFLILLGTIAICYAIAKILVTNKLETVADVAIIVGCFVFGFLAMIIGLVYIQKRTLELLVKKTDTREEKDLSSLIFNRKVYSQGPKIVVIGGGAGLNSVLRGLKKYTDNLTAVVTVSDYGEKSSDSRVMLKTLPLDDIKESLIALSTNEDEMASLLNHKFEEGKLKNLSYGDIYLYAMQCIYNDFSKSVKKSSEVLNITGRVLPVTMEEMKICAELEDGTVIENRTEIPEVVSKKGCKINRIFVNPSNCRIAPGVEEVIQDADAIIIGPGNLYTNVIPNLLVKGVARAIKNCKGLKIYISNIMTEPGQTEEYKLSDHIKAIIDHVGEGLVDYCIYDTGEVVPEFIRKYNEEGSELVEQDIAKAKALGVHLIKRDLATVDDERIRHNPDAIAASIVELICEDMKFKDMQNNPEYMILNDELKFKKKKIRSSRKANKRKNNNVNADKDSKFLNKYQTRVTSIKESEENFKKKNKKAKAEAKESNGKVENDKNDNLVGLAKRMEEMKLENERRVAELAEARMKAKESEAKAVARRNSIKEDSKVSKRGRKTSTEK